MRKLIIAITLVGCFGCSDKKAAEEKTPDADTLQNRTEYTCPMHPEVISGQPGKCPDCNMELNVRS